MEYNREGESIMLDPNFTSEDYQFVPEETVVIIEKEDTTVVKLESSILFIGNLQPKKNQ